MGNRELILQLQRDLHASGYDLKAEPQLLQALEKGLLPEDFMVCSDGLFKRAFSKDIIEADIKEDARHQDIMELHLSRAGLYDELPEGLFFQMPQRASRNSTAADMAADYKNNRKKEEELRRFFLPVEHDFFLQRMEVEKAEVVLLEGLRSGILNDYFARFWNLPSGIPRSFVMPFILLLPYAHKIAGDKTLMTGCLHHLLGEAVEIGVQYHGMHAADLPETPAIGEGQLGVDLVCGEVFWDGSPFYEVAIGPLVQSEVQDYLEGGDRYELLNTFTRFFVPAGMDTVFSVRVKAAAHHMILGENTGPVLGYSTILS